MLINNQKIDTVLCLEQLCPGKYWGPGIYGQYSDLIKGWPSENGSPPTLEQMAEIWKAITYARPELLLSQKEQADLFRKRQTESVSNSGLIEKLVRSGVITKEQAVKLNN